MATEKELSTIYFLQPYNLLVKYIGPGLNEKSGNDFFLKNFFVKIFIYNFETFKLLATVSPGITSKRYQTLSQPKLTNESSILLSDLDSGLGMLHAFIIQLYYFVRSSEIPGHVCGKVIFAVDVTVGYSAPTYNQVLQLQKKVSEFKISIKCHYDKTSIQLLYKNIVSKGQSDTILYDKDFTIETVILIKGFDHPTSQCGDYINSWFALASMDEVIDFGDNEINVNHTVISCYFEENQIIANILFQVKAGNFMENTDIVCLNGFNILLGLNGLSEVLTQRKYVALHSNIDCRTAVKVNTQSVKLISSEQAEVLHCEFFEIFNIQVVPCKWLRNVNSTEFTLEINYNPITSELLLQNNIITTKYQVEFRNDKGTNSLMKLADVSETLTGKTIVCIIFLQKFLNIYFRKYKR